MLVSSFGVLLQGDLVDLSRNLQELKGNECRSPFEPNQALGEVVSDPLESLFGCPFGGIDTVQRISWVRKSSVTFASRSFV